MNRLNPSRMPLSLAAAAIALLLLAASAQASTTAIPLKAAGYSYQEVSWGDGAGFEAVGFPDSAWSVGQAGFGSASVCNGYWDSLITTPWSPGTDMLLRKTFTLPAGATNLKVDGSIDNEATVYVNGQLIGSDLAGNCELDTMHLTALDSVLVAGTNLLAVRAHDDGVDTLIDQSVSYDAPSPCLLYDPTKSAKSGSTVPLKFQLCDSTGANVSSSSVTIHATGLAKLDNSASGMVQDSGNANPGDDFRYDATLGGTGGYIFNKSTKGLTSGTWKLTFTVDGVTNDAFYLRFDVK
jgi:hypothetical protein